MELPFWCPPGYVPVSDIPRVVAAWIKQGHAFSNLPPAQEFMDRLGRALTWAELPGYGVPTLGGGPVVVPSTAWPIEIDHPHLPGRRTDQFHAALLDQPILTKAVFGERCRPMVKLIDLAGWLGASFEPEAPLATTELNARASEPAKNAVEGSDPDEADLPPSKQAILTAWVNGYAQAYKDIMKGRVILRDELLDAVKKHNRGPVRPAREAFKELPPDLRNPPVGER